MKADLAFMLFMSFSSTLPGQCPGKDFLWHRIIFLRDSSLIAPSAQLDELARYEKQAALCRLDNDSVYALLLQRMGWLYTSRNDFSKAIAYTKKSLAFINSRINSPAINPSLILKCYWNLHAMYDSIKLEAKNVEAMDSCLLHAIHLNNQDYQVECLSKLVPYLFNAGDYYKCVAYATLAESITFKTSASSAEYEENSFLFCYWKLDALIFLHRTDEAEKLLMPKIRYAEKHRKTNQMAVWYGLLASLLQEKGQYYEAIVNYKKSFQYNRKISYEAGCAEALNNIGFTYSSGLRQNKMALPYYFKALNFADKNESLNILDNIANIYAQDGKYDSALFFFQKAFDQLSPGYIETDLLNIDNAKLSGNIAEYITGMVLDKAATLLSKYKATGSQQALQEAIRIYQVADRYFDKLRTSQSETQSKLSWKANNRRLYDQAVAACYACGDAQKAFYFFEKSRSILLNDQIQQQQKMDDAAMAKQAQLRKDLLATEQILLNTPPSSKEYLDLQKRQFTITQELDKLIKNTGTTYSAYIGQYADTTLLTLDRVKKNILDRNQSLLEIFTGDSAVYVLAVTTNNTSFVQLNKKLYDSLTAAYISFIAHPGKVNKNIKAFVITAYSLYKLIFQQIKIQSGGSLIISPGGTNFPFEALVTNEDADQPGYLLNRYATSYTYSAKYLTIPFTANSGTGNSLLGMAPVRYTYQNLAELTGSDNSLKTINTYFSNSTNFCFDKATKNNFLQNFTRYNIIQLYTHAAGTSLNNDPVIYFSDSALYLSGLIADRRPVTQLVILSACETANGQLYQGEGIFSFNRGFAAIGIPAAVSNLWSVENESTYRITELFYKYLSQGLPTDVALQKAKLEFINTAASNEKMLPWFWAGAILTGKVDVISNHSGVHWGLLITATILLSLIGFLLLRRLKKNNAAS